MNIVLGGQRPRELVLYLHLTGEDIVPLTMTPVTRARIAEDNDYFNSLFPLWPLFHSQHLPNLSLCCLAYLRVVGWQISLCFRQNFSVL